MSAPYSSEDQARRDALCRPMTMAEVLRRTGRSRRTIERWIASGALTKYEVDHPRQVLFLEREVMELERDKRIAARRGRPAPAEHEVAEGDGVDAEG